MKIRVRLYRNTSQDEAATAPTIGRPPEQVERHTRSTLYFPVWMVTVLIATLTAAGGAWLIWPNPTQQTLSLQSRVAPPPTAATTTVDTSVQDARDPGAASPAPELAGFVTASGPARAPADTAAQIPVRDELTQCQAQLEQASKPESDTQPLVIAPRAQAKARPVRQSKRKAVKKRHTTTKSKPVEQARKPPYSTFWSTRQNDLFLTN